MRTSIRRNKMAHREHGNAFNDVMEMLIANGFDGMAEVLRILLNEAMKIEREDVLAAGAYQRTPDRKGYANGFKPKTVDTRMGRVVVDIPQVRGDVIGKVSSGLVGTFGALAQDEKKS
jgi:transposase-like protein